MVGFYRNEGIGTGDTQNDFSWAQPTCVCESCLLNSFLFQDEVLIRFVFVSDFKL